jgi:hypothetical protein
LAISIIVCSRNKDNLQFILNSINQTIGVEYEVLHSLHAGQVGLAKTYNNLAQAAKFPILVFMHDDLIFQEKNWGIRIIEIMKNEKIGLIGLMGAVYKSKYISIWTSCDKSLFRNASISNGKLSYQKVAVVDGCFMAISKLCFSKVKFDESFQGFHGYDLDYSLAVNELFDVVVATNITFDHLSPGIKYEEWYKDVTYVNKKRDRLLPLSICIISNNIKNQSEYYSLCDEFNSVMNFDFRKIHLFSLYLKMLLFYFPYNRLKYTRTIFKILFT